MYVNKYLINYIISFSESYAYARSPFTSDLNELLNIVVKLSASGQTGSVLQVYKLLMNGIYGEEDIHWLYLRRFSRQFTQR